MAKLNRTDIFENVPVPKAVMSMSIPTITSSLVMMLYNLADTYFVGLLNNPVETSAVTLAAPLILAFNAVNNLFGVGSSSMMSRALGVKDYDTVRKSSAFGFTCSLLCALMFSLLYTLLRPQALVLLGADAQTGGATAGYLLWTVTFGAVPAILNVVLAFLVRAEGATLHASIGTMSGCLLNMVLDPVFILPWGFDMGAAGAGLATCLSNCFACGYFFVLLYCKRGKTCVCLHPKMAVPNKKIVQGVFSVGVPASIQNLLNVTGMTILNNFAAPYGSDAVAALGIAHKISMIPMYVAMGLSQGLQPLVGYNYGSRNFRRMKEAILFSAKLSVGFMAAVTVGYFFGAGTLVRLFIRNESVVAYGTVFLRCLCLAQPFLCMDFLAVGVFQACGMGKKALLFAFLRKIVLEIPALFLWNRIWPLYGLACAQPTAELVLAAAAVVSLARIFQQLPEESRQSG